MHRRRDPSLALNAGGIVTGDLAAGGLCGATCVDGQASTRERGGTASPCATGRCGRDESSFGRGLDLCTGVGRSALLYRLGAAERSGGGGEADERQQL